MQINTDIRMINRKLYVPIILGDGYSTYVRVQSKDALVITFKDKNDISGAKIVAGTKAHDIATDHIEYITDYMLKDDNCTTITHNEVERDNYQIIIVE